MCVMYEEVVFKRLIFIFRKKLDGTGGRKKSRFLGCRFDECDGVMTD